jgi:hypothetical protein
VNVLFRIGPSSAAPLGERTSGRSGRQNGCPG